MRRIWVFILFFAFGCQQTTVNGQQTHFFESENLKTSESEKGSEPRAMSNEQRFRKAQISKLEAQSPSQVFNFSDSQILYYENQIRLADSLYKNYLPQSNFEEVKAAVMFFDSLRLTTDNSQQTTDFFHRFRINKSSQHLSNSQTSCTSDAYLKTVDRCPLSVDIEYQRARAHYYHAVGLTERDDIVGACEHYLRALEIMEPLVETSPLWRLMTKDKGLMANGERLKSQVKENAHSSKLEAQSPDYEKIRFLALTYTRLGRLFTNENYCDLAMSKYKKALNCLNIIKDSIPISYTYKTIGNVYQLLDKADSALYHYRRSLEIYSGLTNKLDIEKSIAQILFEKGEKDSAYIMITNNINKIDNINVRYSYYNTLGEMYVEDKEYDSAAYYLAKSVNSSITSIKVTASIKLSAIYDSIGDYEKKAYYDEIISKISINDVNKSLKNNKIQDVYDRYKERKVEKERAINKKRTKLIVITFTVILILSFAATLFIRYIYKRKQEDYINSIKEIDENLLEKDIIIKQIESEIKEYHKEIEDKKNLIEQISNEITVKKNEIEKLKTTINDNEVTINDLSEDLKKKVQMLNSKKNDIDSYFETEICKKILADIKYKNANKIKKIPLKKLKSKEIIALKFAAKSNLNGLFNRIASDYRKFDNEDIICICLLLLDASTTDISELMGKSYNAVWTRIAKIKGIFNIDPDSNLHSFLLTLV